MSFMCVVASAHYKISQEVNSKLEREVYNKESEILKAARLLYNLVSAAHKHLPINPVLSGLQFSTNDIIATSAKDEGGEEF